MMARPSLLIADDHPVMAEGTSALLSRWFEVRGTVTDLEELDGAIARIAPAVVLLDVSFGNQSSIGRLPALTGDHPRTRFLMLTAHVEPVLVDAAIRAGASGYVIKESPVEELRLALEEVIAGRVYVTPLIRNRRRPPWQADGETVPSTSLRPTERQMEILMMLRLGHTHRRIADDLGIATKTVEYHLNALRRRLGIASTELLIRWAEHAGAPDSEEDRAGRPEAPPGL